MRKWNVFTRTIVTMIAVGVVWWNLDSAPQVQAQVNAGEFELRQPENGGFVGWVVSNADRTAEWWALIDETYQWADTSSVPTDPWKLEAVRIGNPGWGSFTAWQSAVLGRPAAAGKRIIFQNHEVVETSVDN